MPPLHRFWDVTAMFLPQLARHVHGGAPPLPRHSLLSFDDLASCAECKCGTKIIHGCCGALGQNALERYGKTSDTSSQPSPPHISGSILSSFQLYAAHARLPQQKLAKVENPRLVAQLQAHACTSQLLCGLKWLANTTGRPIQ
ncbi:unnamed protein product [Cercospora beticola]|nr:unnamed protein product [Cercospora beticola]